MGKVRWELGRRPCRVLKNESVNRLRWWCEGLEKGEVVMVEGGWVGGSAGSEAAGRVLGWGIMGFT